jgi:predicted metal-dependent hydrolase
MHVFSQRITRSNASSAKRLVMRLSPSGEVCVTAPTKATQREINAFVVRHADWIAKQRMSRRVAETITTGSQLLIEGVLHTVEKAKALRGQVHREQRPDGSHVLIVPGDEAALPRRVRDYLKAQALSALQVSVARHAASLRLIPPPIGLRDTRSRWGSCSAVGVLSFSWRLAMTPPMVLDYVAAHEVAHLQIFDHSPAFWKLCESLAPQQDEAKDWLKKHGSALHAIQFEVA